MAILTFFLLCLIFLGVVYCHQHRFAFRREAASAHVVLLLPLLGHTTTEAEDEVEGALLLDVVVGEGPAVLELLAGEDQALLVRGNPLLVLDLGLDIVDGVGRLDLEGDRLTREAGIVSAHVATYETPRPPPQVKGKERVAMVQHSRLDEDLHDELPVCPIGVLERKLEEE
jgi:hypothetical protein